MKFDDLPLTAIISDHENEIGFTTFCGMLLKRDLLTDLQLPIRSLFRRGVVDSVLERIPDVGEPVFTRITTDRRRRLFSIPGGILDLTDYDNGGQHFVDADLLADSKQPAAITALLLFLEKTLKRTETEKDPDVFLLTQTPSGLSTEALGYLGRPLERGNYPADTLKAFDDIVIQLKSVDPPGRLFLFHGPTGSGKTHCIQGLISACPGNLFLYLPVSLLTGLSGPELIGVFINLHQDHHKPICLILEDADDALLPRSEHSMGSLSTLLNTTSGFLGEALDIRVLATTNAARLEMDPALLRKGRLGGEAYVGQLTLSEVEAIVNRLLPGNQLELNKQLRVLGDVYAFAREHGWVPPARKGNG